MYLYNVDDLLHKRFQMQYTVISILTVVGIKYGSAWKNQFDQLLHFDCPDGQGIYQIKGTHSTGHKDRRFDFKCRSVGGQQNCAYTGFVNNFDRTFAFQCPRNTYIAGVISEHNNGSEDRRFKFRCCEKSASSLANSCYYTSNTALLGTFARTAEVGFILKGVISQHSNKHEDRIFCIKLECKKHDQMIIFYCLDHDITTCGLCIPENHWQCTWLKPINELARHAKNSADLLDVKTGFEELGKTLEELKNNRIQNINAIKDDKKTITTKI
ncbi:unnamed protein product [Mytilus coruscus]|uniref:Uncharacterized protein n=1 Tax=Mytilus coruscus TaxID=42192 RepID=A0A6J8ABV2_MYTCO|nr:unnamed protein product [Mytilus coruscus]